MGRKKAYVLVMRATLSYIWKKHPYMTIWVVIGVLVGIYEGIAYMSIAKFFGGLLAGLLPLILKWIARALLSLDSWERSKFQMERMRRRETYTNYVKEYTEKLINSK